MKGLVEAIEKEGMKTEVPAFNVGDTVKVGFKVIEGTKERIRLRGKAGNPRENMKRNRANLPRRTVLRQERRRRNFRRARKLLRRYDKGQIGACVRKGGGKAFLRRIICPHNITAFPLCVNRLRRQAEDIGKPCFRVYNRKGLQG